MTTLPSVSPPNPNVLSHDPEEDDDGDSNEDYCYDMSCYGLTNPTTSTTTSSTRLPPSRDQVTRISNQFLYGSSRPPPTYSRSVSTTKRVYFHKQV